MDEIKVFEASGSKFVGNEEAQIGVGVVDGELPGDGGAVRKAELNAGNGPNAFLKSRCGCGFRGLEGEVVGRWGKV